jgi:hypothetical protein
LFESDFQVVGDFPGDDFRRGQLESENELLGFPASGHPLELHDYIAWDSHLEVSGFKRGMGWTGGKWRLWRYLP